MKKYVILSIFTVVFFLLYIIYQWLSFYDSKLHITICDVGQGDAVYIRTPHGRNILFDGGPDSSVLQCLAENMPFWERSFDLVILSHPHADHLNGLVEVFRRYSVLHFVTEDLANTSSGYKALQEEVKQQKIPWQTLLDGDILQTGDGISLKVVGPTKTFLDRTAVAGNYISSAEFASLEILLSYRDFSLLLTGDSQSQELVEAIQSHPSVLRGVTILQVPHHGSRTGLIPEILAELQPQLATISVGQNTYGHPAPEILSALQLAHVVIRRTDKEGSVKLKTNGKTYNIE